MCFYSLILFIVNVIFRYEMVIQYNEWLISAVVLMSLCFGIRTSVNTVLSMHSYISNCLGFTFRSYAGAKYFQLFRGLWSVLFIQEQGKSEGFDSCDRPSNLKLDSNHQFFRLYDREIWWMTLQQGKSEGFDSCDRPSNLAQIWSKSSIFCPLWPWNLMDGLGKQ